ncbi:hypothetical protein [Nitrosomonas oligotropha]|uniref:hypothetical protein n=1 Tax=Nitrosomonas oligotropha TaxID=42354 RepID=UPI0013721048|nr:hypothetical protein [Nitrosomonas oligotropha]MXS83545.1 hypothetical protein [Nitrosomonas oligotropha]
MKTSIITSFLLAIGITFGGANAAAEEMSKDEYKAYKDKIDSIYKVSKEKCESFSGNAEDICTAEAKARHNADKAGLEAKYKPTDKTQYEARIAKVDGDYSIAVEKCDDFDGNVKDVCIEEAKAAKIQATNDAKAQMKH